MRRVSLRLLATIPAFALLAAACGGGSGSSSTAGASPSESMMPSKMAHGPMMLPPYAKRMKVSITSPSSGTTVTANSVTVGVSVSGYTDSCAMAGKPAMAGFGHYHVLIDKSLVNMFCTPKATVSMQNVTPGPHTLTVVPALDDHAEVMENAQSITIDYKPTNPLPLIMGV